MDGDENTYNPVEQYMKDIMDSDKPDKPAETTAKPTNKLEIRSVDTDTPEPNSGSRDDALKISDAIKQSINIQTNPIKNKTIAKKIPLETQIFNVKQHPLGFILILLTVIISYAALFSLISFLLPGIANATSLSLSTLGPIAGYLMLIIVVIGLVFLLAFGRAYKTNRLELTDLNVLGTVHSGYFNKKAFRLPIADIENVIVNKSGLFPKLFDYGTLKIKTNKNRNDIVFQYTPNPNICAEAVLDARLEYLASRSFTRP